jgi:hypothetical protein
MDGAYNTTGEGGPEPGDPSICGYCATMLAYDHDGERLSLRLATREEIEMWFADPLFVKALYAVRAVLSERQARLQQTSFDHPGPGNQGT